MMNLSFYMYLVGIMLQFVMELLVVIEESDIMYNFLDYIQNYLVYHYYMFWLHLNIVSFQFFVQLLHLRVLIHQKQDLNNFLHIYMYP